MGRTALRAALLWDDLIIHEETFGLPSGAPRVTVGTSRTNAFSISGESVPNRHVLAKREGACFELDLLDGMTGVLHLRGYEVPVADRTGRTVLLEEGDWASIDFSTVNLFVQCIDVQVGPHFKGPFAGVNFTLAAALWFSLLAQATVVFVALLLWDSGIEEEPEEIPVQMIEWLMPPQAEESPGSETG